MIEKTSEERNEGKRSEREIREIVLECLNDSFEYAIYFSDDENFEKAEKEFLVEFLEEEFILGKLNKKEFLKVLEEELKKEYEEVLRQIEARLKNKLSLRKIERKIEKRNAKVLRELGLDIKQDEQRVKIKNKRGNSL
jgi:hypothetical protein